MSCLYERGDFADLIQQAAERKSIPNPAIVEKDYFVTEVLRILARDFGEVVIFKGGTSLSKGWNLIDRFSEDIDLYVARVGNEDETLDRFRAIADAVGSFPGFARREGRTDKEGTWNAWTEEFVYENKVPAIGGIRPNVLLEAGIQSADQPTESRDLTSILSQVLDEEGADTGTDDRRPFRMRLLHFRRTFVEKLFTLHSRVERVVRQNRELERDARHYYDLAMLLEKEETRKMLETPEYRAICGQYRAITAEFYSGQVKFLPEGMDLSESPALFPTAELRPILERAYRREAGNLCYGKFPTFDEILSGFESIRDDLRLAQGE
ncbi:nucleotidyl transferase AbiEii/AbiGii toxin family protein [Fimbriimonas ginsengisoli]|nr:nucleotidyl transferase AbiEii/AbiGii toxin family protein [Fimbriimonas ginsengisoli]